MVRILALGALLVAAPAWLLSQRGSPAVAPAPAKAPIPCKSLAVCTSAKDSTPPRRLEGRGGQPPDYDFNHTADANESGAGTGRKYIYEHQIQNKNSEKVLWVEWRDASIPFQVVQPCDCAPGYRESGIAPREKPDSEIRYGQAKNFPHTASAYVLQTLPSSSPPSLMTRLFARLLERVVDVIFTTAVQPQNRFVYTVQNKGTGGGTVLFSIPAVTARWAQFQPLDSALKDSNWKTPGGQPVTPNGLFVLSTDSVMTWSVTSQAGTVMREESAVLTIFLNDQKAVLAAGTVSVYLPVRPG